MFQSICLEMSLKPFFKTDEESIRTVCEQVFDDWKPLIEDAEIISVMFWTADGSEILDYKGNLDEKLEWAYFIGGANYTGWWDKEGDPNRRNLHATRFLYTDEVPEVSYRVLQRIIRIMKEVGTRRYPEKQIRMGATFDPGPEFAKSEFKYKRHPEICLGADMGTATMICAYAKLKGDDVSYAGFPDGIPDGLPFGTFLGRQAQHFLTDIGFDFLWLSNGLGFGRETWSANGAIFDGERFDGENLAYIQKEVYDFWTLFRAECPDFEIQTRGTNLSMGIDLASDGVPLAKIYDGGFGLLPPPNSPWAALNGDFGLELMGYLSRISRVPEGKYLFRFYLHDPWWQNSPWYDRYNSQPHDIYLPMACARIDETGKVCPPTHLNILTIDNSCGEMPKNCFAEAIPHLLKAQKHMPDVISPVVWVYPFLEYSKAEDAQALSEMYFGDWFIRGAINQGIPISSVVTTDNFVGHDTKLYQSSVLVSPVPCAGSDYEKKILAYIKAGGRVIFYGNVKNASAEYLDFFRLCVGAEIEGELPFTMGEKSGIIRHTALLCGGGIEAEALPGATVLATAGEKVYMAQNRNAIWIRGTLSSDYQGGLVPHNPEQYVIGETCVLYALDCLGYSIRFDKWSETSKVPVVMLHRSDNAFYVSAYSRDTTVRTAMKFPWGAPILDANETIIQNGYAQYQFPKAMQAECRVFVEQAEDGVVSCRERCPVSCDYRRRIGVNGLQDATVRIFPERYAVGTATVCYSAYEFGEPENGYDLHPVSGEWKEGSEGGYFEAKHVSGNIVISMPVKRNYREIPFED